MMDLINAATNKYRICFYHVKTVKDCMLVTDSGGNKRYIIGYLDDGNLFKERCQHLEENNEKFDPFFSDYLG